MEALLKNATRMRTDPEVQAHFHASADLYKRWSPQGHLHRLLALAHEPFRPQGHAR
ncbi:MAG: hypothetical protein IPJ85_10800 [Flavobacteriales bacterium]|nr:hypothetical protein [Flavobacteriales bacterium]